MRDARFSGPAAPAVAVCLLLLCAACGGGGAEPGVVLPPGFKGLVRFPGFDLGRLSEQEPNDALQQPHILPPCWNNTTMEVSGTLALDAAAWGAVDPMDHLAVHTLVDDRVSLSLDFDTVDRVAAGINNELSLQVIDNTGATVADSGPGAAPRTAVFDTTAGARYVVKIEIAVGNAAYVLHMDVGAGGSVTNKPQPASAPDASKPESAAPDAPAPCADDHVLVGLRDGCDVDAFCAERGLRRGRLLGCGGWCVHFDGTRGAAGQAYARTLVDRLREHDDVLWADPDWIVKPLSMPNDELFPRQWNLRAVGAPMAWDTTTGDPNVVVGVIDTGVIPHHPDLAGRIAPGFDFTSEPYAADGDGWDPNPNDEGDELSGTGFSTWHGTHVGAIIVANQNNRVGGSGMAPNCRIMPLRAIGRGGGLVSDVADALLYAGGLLAPEGHSPLPEALQIVNLSVGLSAPTFVMEDAVNRVANRGTFIVAAAGNNAGAVLYPAAYPTAFAVSAVGANLLSTSYSNFGLEIELAAPGGNDLVDQWNDGWMDSIVSALNDESVYPPVPSYGAYIGTSQAAPHVAGAAALLLSMQPNLTRSQLRQYLIGSALDVGVEGRDQGHGWGLLQVHEAVKLLLADQGQPNVDPPQIVLPATAIRFEGFSVQKSVPIYNAGGQRLELSRVITSTLDGDPWLVGVLEEADTPGGPTSHPYLTIAVDRNVLTTTPGQYTGHIQIVDVIGTIVGRVEVVVHVDHVSRAGCVMRHVVIDVGTGGAPRTALVRPEYGYRYWIKGMPPSTYRLRAGEDLNGNGLYCEPGEACGYFGGQTESEAELVPFNPTEQVKEGLDIWMAPTEAPDPP